MLIVVVLAAAVRVFVFAAAFPPFNNVDEQTHFDMVLRYSHAKPPSGYERFDSESAGLIVLFETTEYFHPPSSFPDGKTPLPVWSFPEDVRRLDVERYAEFWRSNQNYQSMQPPFCYAVAGA